MKTAHYKNALLSNDLKLSFISINLDYLNKLNKDNYVFA